MKVTPVSNVNDCWQGASPKASGLTGELQKGDEGANRTCWMARLTSES
jgi:hypothetical protein